MCKPAQAGNRASKSRCRGLCRDNSSERDADRAKVIVLGVILEPWVSFATSLLHISDTLLRFGVSPGRPWASLGPRSEKSTILMLIPPLARCQLWVKKWQFAKLVRLCSYLLFGIVLRKLAGPFSYGNGFVFWSVFCLALECPMPLHISKIMVFLCVLLVFWHMMFFLKHSGGMFLHVFFVSVFRILEPSHFVEFGTSFWVLFLVILSPVMEKPAKRNTLEKDEKSVSE